MHISNQILVWKYVLWGAGPLTAIIIGFIANFQINKLERKLKAEGESTIALRKRTLVIVQDLRQFINRRRAEDEEFGWPKTIADFKGDMKKYTKAREEYDKQKRHQSRQTEQEYNNRFKVEAILLRTKLLAKMPPEYNPSHRVQSTHDYEHPTNWIGYNAVADDLEMMALILEDQ